MDEPQIEISFTLNGKPVTIRTDPGDRLLDVLRYRLGLTGTKEGCGEGECGACTVELDGVPANSCLVPAYQVRGRDVKTVEAIDGEAVRPMLESGATQCGACTPGVVVTACHLRCPRTPYPPGGICSDNGRMRPIRVDGPKSYMRYIYSI